MKLEERTFGTPCTVKHLFKTDNSLVLAPVIVQSFDCNYALYKTETSLETDNGYF